MENKILSVIIPCYNNSELLKEMIDCFKRQTSSEWEMIIVDDGSTDNTRQDIINYVHNYPQIKVIKRERLPKGSAVCRNIGFDNAQGKYICHLDADDIVSETFVENRVAFMESHPEVDYASFPAKSFSDIHCLPSFSDSGYTWGVNKGSSDLLKDMLKGYDYPFSVWNNIYRKTSIDSYRWDENVLIYTDFSFIVPCILGGLRHEFSNLSSIDYYYRVTPNNNAMTSNFVSKEKCESTIYLFGKTINSLNAYKNSEFYKKKFFDFFLLHLSRLVLRKSDIGLIESFSVFAGTHYNCLGRFRIIKHVARINNEFLRHWVLSLLYALFFGDIRLIKPYLISIKNRFNIRRR